MTQNLSKFQKFETVRINRRDIKNALYNPRKIDSVTYKKLKSNIRRVGLIETLVWNETTGNLVSGHQRLKIMDELEKRDDYDLDVARVRMDEKTEKEQNIFLNNSSAQGVFDRDLLVSMIPEIDIELAGFDDIELNNLGIELDLQKHQSEDVESIISQFDQMNAENKRMAQESHAKDPDHVDWKKVKSGMNYGKNDQHSDDYVVLIFDDHEAKSAFLQKYGFDPDNLYIKGEKIESLIRRQIGAPE